MDSLEILNAHRFEVESLCKEYSVKRLRPCGMTASGSWDLFTADFQFLVEFDGAFQAEHGVDPYFSFRAKLEDVLQGSVDLFDQNGAKSWLDRMFHRSIERDATDWYSA